ncbi:MAG: lipid-A-disaccharide synthase [Hyphomicrobiales bacterium]|nr:lipid-A-disaccharide synthase [Hyphomicrobiales bacterium]
MAKKEDEPRHFFVVAGEPSGDVLGAHLMAALRRVLGGSVRFSGVGGEHMRAEGLASLFPLSEIALMGPIAIARRLPAILRRIRETSDAVSATDADALIIIDSPEFTHRVARRVRRARPELAIIDYVSPSVWAWRPWRARRMRAYVDHILALLPFEPDAHRRLGGPPCSYVGHPLAERIDALRGGATKPVGGPLLVVLPGSRITEVERLMAPFGDTVARVREVHPELAVVIPAVDSVRAAIETGLKSWPVGPEIVSGEAAKLAAFHRARAALAASGTVSLELALARVPMVIAYRVERLAVVLRPLLTVPSVVLPNLILGRNAVPEFIQERCTPENLAAALLPLLKDSEERRAQLAAFDEVAARVAIGEETPSARAAREVLEVLRRRAPIS